MRFLIRMTIVLGMILMISSIAYANNTTADTATVSADTPPDQSFLSSREIYTDVKSALKQLGEALSVGGEHVYKVLVTQALVAAITNTLVYIFVIVILFVLIKKGNFSGDNELPVLEIVGAVIVGLGTIYFCASLNETVTGYLNPEYLALEKIMRTIRGGC